MCESDGMELVPQMAGPVEGALVQSSPQSHWPFCGSVTITQNSITDIQKRSQLILEKLGQQALKQAPKA